MEKNFTESSSDPLSENARDKRRATDGKLCRAMVNNITGYAVILTDPEGYIISLNKGAELILGYQEAEVTGQSIAIFYPPETLPNDGPGTNLKEALINNNYEIKGWRLKKNGVKFLANIHYTALYDETHELLGYTKIIHELSEGLLNHHSAEKLNGAIGANISFRKLIENSYSGITLLNKELKVIYRSLSAERITGWRTGDRVKVTMNEVLHPDDELKVQHTLKAVLHAPGVPMPCTFRSRTFNGDYLWLNCVYTNFLDEPNVNAIVCNFIDVTGERKSKEELIRSENRFKSLLENGSDGISVLSIDRKPIYLSPGFSRILGYSEEEASASDFAQIIHPEDIDTAISKFRKCLSNPGTPIKNVIYRVRHKNGHYVYLEATLTNFLDDPVIGGIVNNFRDITEAKVAEEKIIESENFIKTITDNLPALIAYWDADLHCLFANKPYSDWFEKQPEEMIGISKRDLINNEEFKQHEIHLSGVLAGNAQSFERNFVKPDGKRIFTHTQYIPDKKGAVTKGFYSLIYDITEIKKAEYEIKKKTSQIQNLLENILDGFIALDENRCYTYVNTQVGRFLGIPPESLLGKNIWEVFPDLVHTDIYYTVERVYREKINLIIEDYYEPLKTWQENRVYPNDGGVSIFIRDITKRVREERHLKLLESVITHTADSIMITEAEPQCAPGPRILYVNDAFTQMTGYESAEIVGKSPRFLQGPKTDRAELKRMREAMQQWRPCEISVINYKKNGEEFWLNIAITPVADESGWFTHWIAVERDITAQKIEEQQLSILAEIGSFFNETRSLNAILLKTLKRVAEYGDFCLAEIWLVSPDKKNAHLTVNYTDSKASGVFYAGNKKIKPLVKGEGLPGIAWETGAIQFLANISDNEHFIRRKAAEQAGLKHAYGIPLKFKNEVTGVLVLALSRDEKSNDIYTGLFEKLGRSLGEEIKRKKLEEELNQIFNSAPDIICTAGSDGYFKKVNPAMIKLLGYTELELLNRPFFDFIHPEDNLASGEEFDEINNGNALLYFENRYITRLGKIKWLAWTTTAVSPEGLIYCVARDITDKKELEDLLYKANTLAQIGSWEIDLMKGSVFWSEITKEIHEVDASFTPNLEIALSFYKEGFSRDFIEYKVKEAIESGISWDVELQIVTARGNDKWIRVIGEAERLNNKCVRVYGSFQDIDARKRAEVAVTQVLEDRNTILESIGDAFFAVDKNWTVTYWNNMAERELYKPKEEMLGQKLWTVFADSVDSESYKKYHEAAATNIAMHFEDFVDRLGKWYEISAYPSEDGLSVYFKDVTERKLSETRLKELNESLRLQTKELATSNAELEQFAYVASHDLQEPLRMITGFLTQIEKKYNDKLDDKGRRYINFAVDGAKRMRQIILDLLEFSRVGSMDDGKEEINLGKLIGEVSALYRKQIDEKKASISYGDLPVITSYKTPVRQIFQNLISNSLKYNDGTVKPEIEIFCEEMDANWKFAVKDNGIGIEPEYFDKIFVIFHRLHNKEVYSGTGMGLAITKKIVENLGGSIWVESELGKGSTFYFTILKS